MNEYLDKIKDLYDELVKDKVYVENRLKAIVDRETRVNELSEKLEAKANDLFAKERLIKKSSDLEADKEKIALEGLNLAKAKQELSELKKEVSIKIAELDKSKEEHNKMVEAYKVKSARLNQVEMEL